MPPRKEKERFATVGEKDHWHPYGLQSLNPEKFSRIVTRILKGKFCLLDLKWHKDIQTGRIGN
jgi:hypothetical protein